MSNNINNNTQAQIEETERIVSVVKRTLNDKTESLTGYMDVILWAAHVLKQTNSFINEQYMEEVLDESNNIYR